MFPSCILFSSSSILEGIFSLSLFFFHKSVVQLVCTTKRGVIMADSMCNWVPGQLGQELISIHKSEKQRFSGFDASGYYESPKEMLTTPIRYRSSSSIKRSTRHVGNIIKNAETQRHEVKQEEMSPRLQAANKSRENMQLEFKRSIELAREEVLSISQRL